MLLAPIDLERDTTELEWVMTNARWYNRNTGLDHLPDFRFEVTESPLDLKLCNHLVQSGHS